MEKRCETLEVKGQRLYKLAMEGKEVPREAREAWKLLQCS